MDRHRSCVQDRPADPLARRFCQDRRDPRCSRRPVCFGHAAVQHDDLDGALDPQRAAILCAVRARGIGERIRDKIAASKKKGMWMGGVPPLGYRAEDRKLIVIDSEAEIVRLIFRRYADLGSVRLLEEELDARGINSKSWTSASGRRIGGKPFSRGALYLILQNRAYLGEIVHNGRSHPGGHPPIIDQLLWDAVHTQLASNTAERTSA